MNDFRPPPSPMWNFVTLFNITSPMWSEIYIFQKNRLQQWQSARNIDVRSKIAPLPFNNRPKHMKKCQLTLWLFPMWHLVAMCLVFLRLNGFLSKINDRMIKKKFFLLWYEFLLKIANSNSLFGCWQKKEVSWADIF